VNLLDLLIIIVLVLAALNGFRRGAALQLTVYAGLILGLFAGALLAPSTAKLVSSPPGQAAIALTTLLALAAVGDALGWLIGTHFWALARRSVFGVVDAVAGSIVAIAASLLAVWFIGFNLANGPFPQVSRQIRGSAIEHGLVEIFPRPPSVLAQVRQFLNRFGFPEVFADLPPAPAGPVKGPTKGEAAAAGRKAAPSTVEIVGQACGQIQEGSGFVAAANYIVTNAHVVAGVRSPQVQVQNGGSQPATTVLFDPKLDVAILRVADTPGPALQMDRDEASRGDGAAVLGYPGGGPLTISPAAVRRELDAIGRDIYGRSTVERQVYELQAVVRPGNSGGPFVLGSGIVAGVVFAASTTDPQIGYALTSTEVLPLLQRAEGRTRAVSTEGCTR
jgi:S1-C subfamily serine protease